jgi:hypothetical protein
MKTLVKFFKKKKFATMKELRENGFQTRAVKILMDNGTIEKIKPGLYKLSDLDIEYGGFIEICKSVPNCTLQYFTSSISVTIISIIVREINHSGRLIIINP